MKKADLKENIEHFYLAVDGVSRKEWEEIVFDFISQEITRAEKEMGKALRKEGKPIGKLGEFDEGYWTAQEENNQKIDNYLERKNETKQEGGE